MKSEFMTELEGRYMQDDTVFVLTKDLVYVSRIYGGRFVVPAGFVTDFASVPRIPVVYMVFGNRAHREAVVHDYLYQTHLVKKTTADRIFLEAMKARGKSLWVRWGMYAGVTVGGWGPYKSGPKRYRILNVKKEAGNE